MLHCDICICQLYMHRRYCPHSSSSYRIWQRARLSWRRCPGCWWPHTGSSLCPWCPGCGCGGVIRKAWIGMRPVAAPAPLERRSSANAQWAAGCRTHGRKARLCGPETWWCCSWELQDGWRRALEDTEARERWEERMREMQREEEVSFRGENIIFVKVGQMRRNVRTEMI